MVEIKNAKPAGASEITPEILIDRAKALIPVLQARAREDAANGCVRKETIADIDAAGLWRALAPKRWGGFETPAMTSMEIMRLLGQGDLSVAWISGIYLGHSYHLARFEEQAQADVWGENPGARVVSPYAPDGRAAPVPGGFRISGHWRYSSGSVYSDWAVLGGLIFAEGAPPEYRVFLIPRADYRIVENWGVIGLEGTGSHDLVIEDAFVPEYRTLRDHGLDDRGQPGLALNTGAIYRIPFYQVASRFLSMGQVGALEAMLEAFVEQNSTRLNAMGQRAKLDPDLQLICARVVNELGEMRATCERNFERLEAAAAAGDLPTLQERLLFRYQCAGVAHRCVELAGGLLQAAGGNGIREQFPFELIYRNICAARAHVGNNAAESGRRLGAFMLGEEMSPRDTHL